jgi:hypothetical protein
MHSAARHSSDYSERIVRNVQEACPDFLKAIGASCTQHSQRKSSPSQRREPFRSAAEASDVLGEERSSIARRARCSVIRREIVRIGCGGIWDGAGTKLHAI